MSGANLRFGVAGPENANRTIGTTRFECHPGGTTEAAIILTLGILGMSANIILMTLLLAKKHLRRWSQGLLFHQALVDCLRAAILIPLGRSIYSCVPVTKCSLVETAFLLLVTVSTINMLTTVLNDAPLLPEDSDQKQMPLLMESPQCVLFGTFMIWFASITINLGPTFLSGALAANVDDVHNAPSCPLIMGPLRHYVLNVLWIVTNVLVLLLTIFHLHKLYRDLSTSSIEAVRIASLVTTMISVSQPQNQDPESREDRQLNNYIRRMEKEGVERVKMFIVVTIAYVVFWGPLFLVTLMTPSVENPGLSHEVTLHVAYVHAFVNPALFLVLHKGLRRAVTDILCCNCSSDDATTLGVSGNSDQLTSMRSTMTTSHSNIGVGGMPLSDSLVGSAGLCSTGTMGTLGSGTMGTLGSGTMGTLGPGTMGTLGSGSMGALGPNSIGTLGAGPMGTLGTGVIGGATALPPSSFVGGAGGGLVTYVPDGDITPPFASLNRSYLYNDVSNNPTNLHSGSAASHEEFSSLHRSLHGQSSTKGRLA